MDDPTAGPPDPPQVGLCDRPGHKGRRVVFTYGPARAPQRLCLSCIREIIRRGDYGSR